MSRILALLALLGAASGLMCELDAPWGEVKRTNLVSQTAPGKLSVLTEAETDCAYVIKQPSKGVALTVSLSGLKGLGGEPGCCSSYVEVMAGSTLDTAASLGVFCADQQAIVSTSAAHKLAFLRFVKNSNVSASFEASWAVANSTNATKARKCASQNAVDDCKTVTGCRWCESQQQCMNVAILCPGQKCSAEELEEDAAVEKEKNESTKLIGDPMVEVKAASKATDAYSAIREASEAKARADYAVTAVKASINALEQAMVKDGAGGAKSNSSSNTSSASSQERESEIARLEEQLVQLQAVAVAAENKVALLRGLATLKRVMHTNHTANRTANANSSSVNSTSSNATAKIEDESDEFPLDSNYSDASSYELVLGGCKNGSCWTSSKTVEDASEKPDNPDLLVDEPVMIPVATSVGDEDDTVNVSAIPELLAADPNMDDNATNIASRGKKLKLFLTSNNDVLDQLVEHVENAESPTQKSAIKNATEAAVVGLLNRVNDLLTICVDDNAPMNLPFAEYIDVMMRSLQKMLQVVQAAKRNGIKL